MRCGVGVWTLVICLTFAAPLRAAGGAETPSADASADRAARVDRLFAKWEHDTTPGGVAVVVRDGAVVYRHAFGMASLEFGVPNTPQTPFHIASLSKQFTGLAVLLLQQDGKLSLDDDVRKYVPELPDFGHAITLRHCLNHTSGLRDKPHLMWMAGWRFEDETTTEDVLRLFSRQRALNFNPGDESLYSNTGFVLLGLVVERVSGGPVAEFSRERIFTPLGMTHTLIQGDHHRVVKGRAASYRPAKGGGYECLSLSDSSVGETGVVTTADDMTLWDRNFEAATVGGKELIARMQEPARRNDGGRTRYAAGLGIDEYRGLRVVEHSGSIAAYRCHYVRFPDQRTSVIVLGNAEDLPATELAHQVADVFLEDRLAPRPPDAAAGPAPVASPAVEVPSALLDAYAGDYLLAPGDYVTITRDGDRLMVQGTGSGRVPLTPTSRTSFALQKPGAGIAFEKKDGAAEAESIRLTSKGKERLAKRVPAAPPSDFVGSYYSPELGVVYEVSSRDGKLYLRHPRGEVEMKRTTPDAYEFSFPLKAMQFGRDASNRCDHFLLDAERVRRVRFDRVELPG